MQAIRMGDWKLVKTNLQKAGETLVQLYNLKSDPSETADLAAGHPEVVERLEQKMDAMRTDSPLFPLFELKKKVTSK